MGPLATTLKTRPFIETSCVVTYIYEIIHICTAVVDKSEE